VITSLLLSVICPHNKSDRWPDKASESFTDSGAKAVQGVRLSHGPANMSDAQPIRLLAAATGGA
jgi:hypothetical protein